MDSERKPKRKEKRNKQRFSYPLHFIYGEDDDLILLIQATDKFQRQALLKKALRIALDLPIPETPNPVADLATKIEQIERSLYNQNKVVANLAKNGSPDVQEQIAELRRQLDQLARSGMQPTPIQEADNRVDDADIQKRLKNLKKSDW